MYVRAWRRCAAGAAAVAFTAHTTSCQEQEKKRNLRSFLTFRTKERTTEQKAEPTALAAHWRWHAEDSQPDYNPPDTSWPPPDLRPRPEHVPSIRRKLAECGDETNSKCHQIGTALAIGLLGGVVFGHDDNKAGTEENTAEGIALLRALSARGCAEAAYGIGMCYGHGFGVETDEEMAFEYYTISAEQGFKDGQYALGLAHYLGDGTPPDSHLAVHWFERAAAQSEPNAMFMLGECLFDGIGVIADRDAAYRWFMAAGELGHVGARARVRCHVLGMPQRQPVNPALPI